MIVLENVSKRYGDAEVLDEISLRLGDVGVTSIIGPNGAGKSTLFSVIGRLLRADSGTVTIDDLAAATAAPRDLARTIAVLRQDNHLTARLTVLDLVEFGRFPHSRGRLGPQDRAAVDDALGYLELDGLRDRFLDQLSGGQRQRVFVAMVLAQDTRYVLLDEPLNNLDLRHAVEIMRLLRRLADERGRRVVVVLHDINVAAAYSDRIVALRDGRVVADGPPADVITGDVLTGIYDLPVDVRLIDERPVALYYG